MNGCYVVFLINFTLVKNFYFIIFFFKNTILKIKIFSVLIKVYLFNQLKSKSWNIEY